MVSFRSGPGARHRQVLSGAASAAVAVAAAVALAACGSSSSSSSSSAAAASGSSGASSPTTSSGASSTNAGSASTGVSQAQAFLAKYSKPPTSVGTLTPLPKPAAKGKTLVFLQCEEEQCAEVGKGFAAAAKAIGWNLKTIGFNSTNPATLTAALTQALEYHPVAVEFQGNPYQQWASSVPAYKKAGVPMIPITLGTVPTSSTVPVEIGSPKLFDLYGKLIADWFIADSHGTGHAVFANVPGFPTFAITGQALTKEVAKECPKCSVKTVNLTISELDNNQVVPTLVSALRSDPSAKYALAPDGGIVAGLPAALNGAGLSGITVSGGSATEENEQDLLNGTEKAWLVQSFEQQGWIGVDIAARLSEGLSVPAADQIQPTEVLTKANVGKPEADYAVPSDYEKLYAQLWSK